MNPLRPTIVVPFLMLASFLAPSESAGSEVMITGKVVDEAGNPLPDVRVKIYPAWMPWATDTEGEYFVEEVEGFGLGRVVWFSKQGYQPVVKVIEELPAEVDVVMTPLPSGAWKLGTCEKGTKGDPVRFGGLVFFVPEDAVLFKGRDIDFETLSIWFGPFRTGEAMLHGSGMYWTSGLPNLKDLVESEEIIIRDIFFAEDRQLSSDDVIDVRGTKKDGTRWRYIGYAFGSITYDGVSKEAADFFESILDTFCIPEKDKD